MKITKIKCGAIFSSYTILLCTLLASCASTPAGKPIAESQEEPRKYQNSLHYLTLDTRERILVASTNGFIARIDDLQGRNETTYGSWGLDTGNFRLLLGIAVDSRDRIYIVDQKNQRLVRIDDFSGKGWTTIDFSSGETGTYGLRGLCIDKNDRIYLTDEAKHKIVRMDDIEGNNLVQFGGYGSGVMQFASPCTLDTDSAGRLYIIDYGNRRLVRMDDMTGKGWVTYGGEGDAVVESGRPLGVALNAQDQILLTLGNGHLVQIDDMDGGNRKELNLQALIPGQVTPLLLAGAKFDSSQRILFMDYGNGAICRIDSIAGAGFISYSFGKSAH